MSDFPSFCHDDGGGGGSLIELACLYPYVVFNKSMVWLNLSGLEEPNTYDFPFDFSCLF